MGLMQDSEDDFMAYLLFAISLAEPRRRGLFWAHQEKAPIISDSPASADQTTTFVWRRVIDVVFTFVNDHW